MNRWRELFNARTLSFYALREHVGPFLFAMVIFTAIMLMNQVARQLQHLAGKGLGADVILQVFLLSIPLTVAITIPMATLVATMAAFGRLSGDNEITAIQANGVGFHQILVPSVLGAAAIALGTIALNDSVLPDANHELTRLMGDIQRTRTTFVLQEKRINDPTGLGEWRMIPQEIDRSTNMMYDLRIFDMTDLQEQRTILADSGRLDYTPDGADAVLTLWHGQVHHRDTADPLEYEILHFDRQQIVLRDVGSRLDRSEDMDRIRSDREMDLGTLLSNVHEEEGKIFRARDELFQAVRAHVATLVADTFALGAADTTGTGAIRFQRPIDQERYRVNVVLREGEGIDYAHRQRNAFLVEYHKKFAIPIACIVFVLVGAPIGVRSKRGGYGFAMGASTLVFVVYYLLLTGGEDLADRRFLPPWLSMWGGNLIFLALGAWLLRRTARETSARRWRLSRLWPFRRRDGEEKGGR